jgi:hypothetical protein
MLAVTSSASCCFSATNLKKTSASHSADVALVEDDRIFIPNSLMEYLCRHLAEVTYKNTHYQFNGSASSETRKAEMLAV